MNSERGFTLIEVLAAMAVLALALGATISAGAFYTANLRDLEDRMLAGWVAHNLMVETQLEPRWPAKGRKTRDLELAGQEWSSERVVEDTPDSYIRRVTVRVRRADAEEGWLVSRAAFLAEPAGKAPAVPQGGNTPNGGGNTAPGGAPVVGP